MPSDVRLYVLGKGLGECIVVGIPNYGWIIVDSFIDKMSENPAALDLLSSLGVSTEDVKALLVTHWHTDHICGITEIARQCKSAAIWVSAAMKTQEFVALAASYVKANRLSSDDFMGGVAEAAKLFSLAREDQRTLSTLNQDKRLFTSPCEQYQIWSLSPPDATCVDCAGYFSNLYSKRKYNQTMAVSNENYHSVVLLIMTPEGNFLLGGDLEVHKSNKHGWKAILESQGRPKCMSKVFKVPHHGSITGHNEDIWVEMISPNAISIVTEFSRSGLPKDTDIERLQAKSKSVYQTSRVNSKKHLKSRPRNVQNCIKQFSQNAIAVEGATGRVSIDFSGGVERVVANEPAFKH